MLDHGEKDCLEKVLLEENGEKGNAQYEPWLRGELGRRVSKEMDGTENRGGFFNNHREEGAARVMGIQPRKNTTTDRKTSEGEETVVETNRKTGCSQGTSIEVLRAMKGSTEGIHENGKVKTQGEKHEGEGDKISKGNLDETKKREDIDMGMARVT